jgi:hypothetical protein
LNVAASFGYINRAEFERTDNFLGWCRSAFENLVDPSPLNAGLSCPRGLASRSLYF